MPAFSVTIAVMVLASMSAGFGLASSPENSVWTYPILAAAMGFGLGLGPFDPRRHWATILVPLGFAAGMTIEEAIVHNGQAVFLSNFILGLFAMTATFASTVIVRHLRHKLDNQHENR